MRIFYTILLLFIAVPGFSQTYGDKSFYLIDSTILQNVGKLDSVLLYKALVKCHTQKEDTTKFKIVLNFVNKCQNLKAKEAYNDWVKVNAEISYFSARNAPEKAKAFGLIIGKCYAYKSKIAKVSGVYVEAIDYGLLGLRFADYFGDTEQIISSYIDLGIVYHLLGEEQQALFYLQIAKRILKLFPYPKNEVRLLNNLSVIHEFRGESSVALDYLNQSLRISEIEGDQYGQGMALNNMGSIYLNLDSNSLAIGCLMKALDNFKELENKKWLSLSYREIAEVYLHQGKITEAFVAAKKAYNFAVNSGELIPLMEASEIFYEIHKKHGNPVESLFFHEKYVELKDSLAAQNVNRLSTQQEKSNLYARKKLEKEKENEKRIKIAQYEAEVQMTVSLSIAAIVLVLILFLILTNRKLRTIILQKKIIEIQSSERKVLLQEIHHRVKNNFQIVSSILKLQAAEEDNAFIDIAFNDAINRIHSMSAVHELIYRHENFSIVSVMDYFSKLTDSMEDYSTKNKITFELESEIEELSIDMLIPLGISLNELIINSIKYAFNDFEGVPKVRINLWEDKGVRILSYQDNGVGGINLDNKDSFGMDLILTIIDQIGGELENSTDEINGWSTSLRILF